MKTKNVLGDNSSYDTALNDLANSTKKLDPTLGGRIDPYAYIDDFEAKMLFNASKHDVDVARSGGAEIGSLSQKIMGNSGGITSDGQYIADPKMADPNMSLANAIRKHGFSAVYNEILPEITNGTLSPMKGYPGGGQYGLNTNALEELRQAYNKEVKERSMIDQFTTLKLPEDDINILINLDRKGGESQASTFQEFKALKKLELLKGLQRQMSATDPEILEMQYNSNLLKLKRDFPMNSLAEMRNVPDELIGVTSETYIPALKTLAKKKMIQTLNDQYELHPDQYPDNPALIGIVDRLGSEDSPVSTIISGKEKRYLVNGKILKPEEFINEVPKQEKKSGIFQKAGKFIAERFNDPNNFTATSKYGEAFGKVPRTETAKKEDAVKDNPGLLQRTGKFISERFSDPNNFTSTSKYGEAWGKVKPQTTTRIIDGKAVILTKNPKNGRWEA